MTEYCAHCHMALPHDQRICAVTKRIRELMECATGAEELPGLGKRIARNETAYLCQFLDEVNCGLNVGFSPVPT